MLAAERLKVAVGFDGGGTKTECVVLDADGNTIGRGMAGPSNPTRVAPEKAFAELARAAAEALDSAHLKPREIGAVCAGLAGVGRRSAIRGAIAFLAHEFPDALIHVTTDTEVALEAAVGDGMGVALIAGTGSSALGRNAAGVMARAGGFGRWIGDDGSAYEIGRRAVAFAVRARDQAAPVSALSEMMLPAVGCATWDELMERIAKNPDDVFPRLFPAVASAAEQDDDAAREILYAAALDLSSMALTVVRRLEMQDRQFPLVKCGGVFSNSPLVEEIFDSVFASMAPHAAVSTLRVPAAVGAAKLAARLSGQQRMTTSHGADQ